MKIAAVAALAIAAALGLSGASPASAACGSTIQKGTVIQYKNSTGVVRPGWIVGPGTGSTWDLVSFKPSDGTQGFFSNISLDQTGTTNNTFLVLSCAFPF